jgi:hypothetical protein
MRIKKSQKIARSVDPHQLLLQADHLRNEQIFLFFQAIRHAKYIQFD